jgi:hypothetical protein
MGCGSMIYTKMEGKILKQEKIELEISNNNKSKELSDAQSLILIITNLYNKIIYDYDSLIYNTGACIFKCPNIIHCTKCLFFKISSECDGNLNLVEFVFKEDPPFFTLNRDKISQETKDILDELFAFVTNLKDYRMIIKRLDKETPKLMYIIHENNHNISKENIDKINKSLSLFHELSKLRNSILVKYKNQIYDLIMSSSNYCSPINKLGKLAKEKNLTDKYEIVFLFNQLKSDVDFIKYFSREDWRLYSNINDAKQNMEKKLKEEELNEEYYNISNNKYFTASTRSTSLSSSYRMYLPIMKQNE